MDRGILDRTHLHFFTRDTASALLQSAGLKIERISCTGVPLDEVWKTGEGKLLFNFFMRSQHLALSALPRLFAMQWIFIARPAVAAPTQRPEPAALARSAAGQA
jgi:hypothetical protein